MSDATPFGLPEAAHRLGMPLRNLRHAMRAGHVPTAGRPSATMRVTPAWLESARAAIAATPGAIGRKTSQKVAPFARYQGTSAWRKYPNRVREHAHFLADAHRMDAAPAR